VSRENIFRERRVQDYVCSFREMTEHARDIDIVIVERAIVGVLGPPRTEGDFTLRKVRLVGHSEGEHTLDDLSDAGLIKERFPGTGRDSSTRSA
jgi:hypothetical protein